MSHRLCTHMVPQETAEAWNGSCPDRVCTRPSVTPAKGHDHATIIVRYSVAPANRLSLITHSQKDVPCYAFIYTPAGNPLVESVVRSIQAANQPYIPASQIMGLADTNQVRISAAKQTSPNHTTA